MWENHSKTPEYWKNPVGDPWMKTHLEKEGFKTSKKFLK
jgi:hypothetical protein